MVIGLNTELACTIDFKQTFATNDTLLNSLHLLYLRGNILSLTKAGLKIPMGFLHIAQDPHFMVNLISSIESSFMVNKNKRRFTMPYILAWGLSVDISFSRIDNRSLRFGDDVKQM